MWVCTRWSRHLVFPRTSSPRESSCLLPWALLSGSCPRLLLSEQVGWVWESHSSLGPDSHLAPPGSSWPFLQGGDGSSSGQWVLATPAELFYLISSLLLPRSQSFFRASGMPLGVPQAVGESLLCLLWDGSLCFCQEAGSQQLAGGNTGTPCRYLEGWWRELGALLGFGSCCHPHWALNCLVSWLFSSGLSLPSCTGSLGALGGPSPRLQ